MRVVGAARSFLCGSAGGGQWRAGVVAAVEVIAAQAIDQVGAQIRMLQVDRAIDKRDRDARAGLPQVAQTDIHAWLSARLAGVEQMPLLACQGSGPVACGGGVIAVGPVVAAGSAPPPPQADSRIDSAVGHAPAG